MFVEPVSTQNVRIDTRSIVGVKPGAAHPSPEKKEGEKPDVKLLQEVLEVAQDHFQVRNIGLKIAVHEETGVIKVTVVDKDSGELIREVPPQQVLNLMAKIDEMMGILYDQKA